MQNHRPPSFFLTNTTALHHTLWLGLIVPDSIISCRWFQSLSTRGGGICLNHSLKGVSSVTFIMCLVEWVQPNSVGSNKNMLWYLAKSQQVASASSGGQESNPLKSSSSNSFPCLCLTVNFGVWGSLGSFPHPTAGSSWVVWAPGLPWLPWPLGFSFGGSVAKLYCFYHHDCLPTSLPQPCVHILYGEALWQRAVFSL